MPSDKFQIKINSILGGESMLTDLNSEGQFQASLGIDPSLPGDDNDAIFIASGLLRPVSVINANSTLTGVPLWAVPNPKDKNIYVYDSAGSAYTYDQKLGVTTVLNGIDDLVNSDCNGLAYYDNYVYFAQNTTVARYGPLDGSPSMTDDYWVGTLGLTELNEDNDLPRGPAVPGGSGRQLPNHFLHRHSDGRLYMADFVGGTGTLHYIQTSKTTVEGDTDDGSTYDKLNFGYGLMITAIETYGDFLAIAIYEGGTSTAFGNLHSGKAKIAFWDTTSQKINSITWVEFPDEVITSLKNVNGILYVTSGSFNFPTSKFRLSRFVGGFSFDEVFFKDTGSASYPGAVYGVADQLLFGGNTFYPLISDTAPCVYTWGLRKGKLGKGLFTPFRGTGNGNNMVTALCPSADANNPLIFYGNLFTHSNGGIDRVITGNADYSTEEKIIWLEKTKPNYPFKITKITLPLFTPVEANTIVDVKIYVDDNNTSFDLEQINNTNDPGSVRIVRRSASGGEVIVGDNNFWIEIVWSGAALCTVSLPIIIDYEEIRD